MGDPADGLCQWRVRDLAGWREGILLIASADLLIAWHSASLSAAPGAWTAMRRHSGDLVEQVRQARLAGRIDRLEDACRHLVALAHGGGPRPMPGVRAAMQDLRRALILVNCCAPCLDHCGSCTGPHLPTVITDRGPSEPVVAGHVSGGPPGGLAARAVSRQLRTVVDGHLRNHGM